MSFRLVVFGEVSSFTASHPSASDNYPANPASTQIKRVAKIAPACDPNRLTK